MIYLPLLHIGRKERGGVQEAATISASISERKRGRMPSISHELTRDVCVKGRLVLYVGMFCPFATRVTIARSLKGLEDIVPIVKVNSVMDPNRKSWTFQKYPLPDQREIGIAGNIPEPFYDAQDLRQLYWRNQKISKKCQDLLSSLCCGTWKQEKLSIMNPNHYWDKCRHASITFLMKRKPRLICIQNHFKIKLTNGTKCAREMSIRECTRRWAKKRRKEKGTHDLQREETKPFSFPAASLHRALPQNKTTMKQLVRISILDWTSWNLCLHQQRALFSLASI